MIVWLASFPRSGNTFLRIVLNRLYGVTSSVVYDVDRVATRVGEGLVGYEDRPASYEAMRRSADLHFIKTHRQRGEQVEAEDRAICIARDGRDALVSWARQRSEADGATYAAVLRGLITYETPTRTGLGTDTGGWGHNVLSWFQAPLAGAVMLRYEALVADPVAVAAQAMAAVAPDMAPRDAAQVPSFAELQQTDPLFFRRGVTGTHRDEMPEELQALFWSRPANREAMALLGYG